MAINGLRPRILYPWEQIATTITAGRNFNIRRSPFGKSIVIKAGFKQVESRRALTFASIGTF
jgi:hypothetical protein